MIRNNTPRPPPPYNGNPSPARNRFEELVLEEINEPPGPDITCVILGILVFSLLGVVLYIFFLLGQEAIIQENKKGCIFTTTGRICSQSFIIFTSSTIPINHSQQVDKRLTTHSRQINKRLTTHSRQIDNLFPTPSVRKPPFEKDLPSGKSQRPDLMNRESLQPDKVDFFSTPAIRKRPGRPIKKQLETVLSTEKKKERVLPKENNEIDFSWPEEPFEGSGDLENI